MYDFMMNRLRDETKSMDLDIERLGKEVKSLVAEHESSALMLHQAQAQKTRAIALVHTLTRHLEVGRTQRKLKMDKMESALSEQESRLRAFEDRERKRVTLSLIPRVRCHFGACYTMFTVCHFIILRRGTWMKMVKIGSSNYSWSERFITTC
jgi:hypothetical protein